MTGKWENIGEWYEAKVHGEPFREADFLRWLIMNGKIDGDMIQDFFQDDMTQDGFFDDWPEDAPVTIDFDERTATCRECSNTFDYDDFAELDEDDFDCDMAGYEEPEESGDETCPLKLWCRNRKAKEEEE